MLTDIANYISAHTPPAGQPDPDLSAARGNLFSDVSANSCATKAPPHPAISGDATVGSTLTADPGRWDTGMTFSYQWLRDGHAIDGATRSTYVAVAADVDRSITVAITGAKLGYETTTRTSDPVAVKARTVSTSGQVGGEVPATLSLALGAMPSFGSFTPGVAKEYLASTTANVISTAGDASLSIADPDTAAPGQLANGSFRLPRALQARAGAATFTDIASTPLTLRTWAAPVSNESVAVEFRQAIGETDALRTGPYTKTLTLTLSTTTP